MKRKIKILLADDHEILRNGIRLMLSSQNVFSPVIDEAKDGDEVVDKANKNFYDVILLDINMPKLDGLAVAKKLNSKNKNSKILVLTVYSEDYIIDLLHKCDRDINHAILTKTMS